MVWLHVSEWLGDAGLWDHVITRGSHKAMIEVCLNVQHHKEDRNRVSHEQGQEMQGNKLKIN